MSSITLQSSGMSASYASQRIAPFTETVFAKFTRLAQEHQAINLGQGFPDFAPPDIIMSALKRAAEGYQQYAPLAGMPALNTAVATARKAVIAKDLDPQANVLVTVGATEGLFAICQALIDPGDEVVLLEPFYDAYPADVLMAGGIPKYVPLYPQSDGNWLWDDLELTAAFSPRTKAVFVNTPNNPTGKVFSVAELDRLIALASEHDALIISDEAYEYLAFTPHISPASRPGGWERTLTVSSVGKTFSVTGWKIGYVVGPDTLIHAVKMAHQWIPFVVATPLQVAAAEALSEACQAGSRYFADTRATFQSKCQLLLNALEKTAFKALPPQGGYFVVADSSALGYSDDMALCEALPARAGVAAIPPSAFYSTEHKGLAKHLVRFAFCKTDEALSEAGRRLARLEP